MPGYSSGYGPGERYNPKVHLDADGAVALQAARVNYIEDHVATIRKQKADPAEQDVLKLDLFETVLDWLAQADVADPIQLATAALKVHGKRRVSEPAEAENTYGGY